MGERIGMDIANVIWDRVLNIVNNNDFTGAKEEFLKVLAMEIPFTEEEYENGRRDEMAERASRRLWLLQAQDRPHPGYSNAYHQAGI